MSQQALTPQQVKFVALTCQGQKNTDIAKALGVTGKTNCNISCIYRERQKVVQLRPFKQCEAKRKMV